MAATNEDDGAAYLPSRREIARQCQNIQATWSDYQRSMRRVGPKFDAAVLPFIAGAEIEGE